MERQAGVAEARFEYQSALSHLAQAIKAEPAEYRYYRHYRVLQLQVNGASRGQQIVNATTRDGVFTACESAAAEIDWPTLHRLARIPQTSECAAFYLVSASQHDERELVLLERASTKPFAGDYLAAIVPALLSTSRAEQAETLLRKSLAQELTPRSRIAVSLLLLSVLETEGKRAEAQQFRTALELAIRRSNLPSLEYWYVVMRTADLIASGQSGRVENAAALAEQHGALVDCASALAGVMAVHIDRGDMQNALRVAPRATVCANRAKVDEVSTRVRTLQGRAQLKTGDSQAAINVLKSALPYAEQSGSAYLIADVHHNLAHAYEKAGARGAAEHEVRAFVNAASSLGLDPLRVVSLRDAGIIYWDSHKRREARKYFDDMVRLIDEQKHDHYWAGEYYERVGDFARARRYYQAARQAPGDTARKAAALTRIYLALNAVDSAGAFARLHDRLEQTPEEVMLMPVIQAARGDYANALRGARSWAATQQQRGNVAGAVNTQLQVAEIAQAMSNVSTMSAAARTALRLLESDSASEQRARALAFLGDALAQQDSPRAWPVLERAVVLAQAAGTPGIAAEAWAAYGGALLRKGRVAAARAAIDSALIARRGSADHFEHGFDRVRFRNAVAQRIDVALAAAVRQGDVENAYAWSVRRKAEQPEQRSLRAVQQALKPDEVVIDYTVGDAAVAALVITRSSARVQKLAVTRAQLRSYVEALRTATATSFGRLDLSRAHYDEEAARLAYNALVRPIAPLLENHAKWRIAADDALHFLPFDALLDGKQYVIDRAAISYVAAADAPSATQPSLRTVLFVASAAPGVAEEARALALVHPRIMQPRAGRELASALSQATVLHIATHAYADAAHPLSSYLRLGSGKLEVDDIERLDISGKLVVLTACETAYGKLYAGAPFGLANAFTRAGAQSVVATLWPVGSASAVFSRAFYSALNDGLTPSEALRKAKLSVRKANASPLVWAPFVLLN